MQIEAENYRLHSPHKIKDTIKAVYFDFGEGYKRTGSLCVALVALKFTMQTRQALNLKNYGIKDVHHHNQLLKRYLKDKLQVFEYSCRFIIFKFLADNYLE